MKTVLVVGASGATGNLLVTELLNRGLGVRVIVRSVDSLPESIRIHPHCSIICASLLDLSDAEISEYSEDCMAIASCLGHNLTLKGLFGKPRLLVTQATVRLCKAIQGRALDKPVKFVLMNTVGNQNLDLKESRSSVEKLIMALFRLLLPPQQDNEKVANYLRSQIGQAHDQIEWTAVRPDSLINEPSTSEYRVVPSPIRSALFNSGKTSRINVAHFMADLITEETVWKEWKGKMPVIYNAE